MARKASLLLMLMAVSGKSVMGQAGFGRKRKRDGKGKDKD
jgi:hypothetical protein